MATFWVLGRKLRSRHTTDFDRSMFHGAYERKGFS